MENLLVSVIIPAYNRAHLIGETLDSVLAQTYPHWECIVVDDHSSDNTGEIVEAYCQRDARIKLFRRPEDRPKGANACRNYGFSLSSGDYIQWFDSDDTMHINHLKAKVNRLTLNNDSVFVACSICFFSNDDLNNILYIKTTKVLSDPFLPFLKGEVSLRTNAPMWRKSFLIGKELFNENLHRAQEWEFFGRMLLDVKKYDSIEYPLVMMRIHENNISSQFAKGECIKIYSDFQARWNLFFIAKQKKTLDTGVKYKMSDYALKIMRKATKCSFKVKTRMFYFWIMVHPPICLTGLPIFIKRFVGCMLLVFIKRGASLTK